MKTTTTKIILLCCLLFLLPNYSKAWDGFDYDEKTSIEISTGNLVREGSIIQFYETKTDRYKTAKIVFMQSVTQGTEIELLDLDSNKIRVFVMRN